MDMVYFNFNQYKCVHNVTNRLYPFFIITKNDMVIMEQIQQQEPILHLVQQEQ